MSSERMGVKLSH